MLGRGGFANVVLMEDNDTKKRSELSRAPWGAEVCPEVLVKGRLCRPSATAARAT